MDQTIEIALQQRSKDFNGVITCSPNDTLASILSFIKERRVHRFVIVQDEDEGDKKKGSLIGILSLSDVLRWLVGDGSFLKGVEVKGLGVVGLKSEGTELIPKNRRGSAGTEGSVSVVSEEGISTGGREIEEAMATLSV